MRVQFIKIIEMDSLVHRLSALQNELQSIINDCGRKRKRLTVADLDTLQKTLTDSERSIRRILLQQETWKMQQQAARQFFRGISRSYNIILADPPWQYRTPTWEGGTHSHYDTLNIKQLSQLPVMGLAAEDCMLLMWATWPKLEEAVALMRDWGFSYKTVFTVWVKQNKISDRLAIGSGCYTRANTEFLLLATRGHIVRYQQDTNFVSVYVSHKGRHSEKPAAIYRQIYDRIGDLPRIELFARRRKRGWDAWGNECCESQIRDSRERQLKERQDALSALAHKCVRMPADQALAMLRASNHINTASAKTAGKIYAQTLHVTDDYSSNNKRRKT